MTNGYKNPAALFMGTQHFSIHFRKREKIQMSLILEPRKEELQVWYRSCNHAALVCAPLNLIHNSLAEVIFLIASSSLSNWWWWWDRSIRHIIPASKLRRMFDDFSVLFLLNTSAGYSINLLAFVL
jgi:hypothetical protein